MISPISVIREAIKAVPAVKFALGVAGLGAVVAIVAAFDVDIKVAAFGVPILLGLMFVLVIFARAARAKDPAFRYPAVFATWSFLLITIGVVILLVTSWFWEWPRPLEKYVKDNNGAIDSTSKASQEKKPSQETAGDNDKAIVVTATRTFSSTWPMEKSLLTAISQETGLKYVPDHGNQVIEVVIPPPTTYGSRYYYKGGCLQLIVDRAECQMECISLEGLTDVGVKEKEDAEEFIEDGIREAIKNNHQLIVKSIASCLNQ